MKYLVFHHQTRNIEEINFSEETLQAINLENRNDEPQILKGFQCITFNLKRSQVSGAVFDQLPGIYDIQLASIPAAKQRGRAGKGKVSIIKTAKLEKACNLPNRQDQILILGARGIKDGKNPETGKLWRGITLDMVDTTMELLNDEQYQSRGVYVTPESIEGLSLNQCPSLPGWYKPQWGIIRNTKGEELERLLGITFVEEFKMEHLINVPPQQKAA